LSKAILGVIAGLVLGVALTWTLLRHKERGEENKKPEKEELRILHTNGQTLVKLDQKAQEKAGLKIAPLEPATLKPEIKGYGRVLDPGPLAALLVELTSARAALEASTKEFQRLKILHGQDQNVSTRALETAEAAAKRDQIAVDAAQIKLATGWGKAVASQPDLSAFVRPLVALEAVLVRIDLPLGEALEKPPSAARIAALTAEDHPVEAEFLGPTVSADPQTQGQGFLFLLKRAPLTPGAAVVGWLSLPGDVQNGVVVPRSALVRHESEVFVYLQTAEHLFLRKEIDLEHPLANGWFVDEGLKPKQNIVVTGAQQLLSEDLKGQGEE
jgi:multidrug efflux pump subunit AcrA (membrane-fusion protein)